MDIAATPSTADQPEREPDSGLEPSAADVVTIRSGPTVAHRAQLQAAVGVATETTGAAHLSLNVVTIPPGAAARPHRHHGVETAVYILSGEVETRYGPALERRATHRAGDFVYIPAGVPHQPTNLSRHVPAVAVVAHSAGDDQTGIIWHDRDGEESGR